MNSTAHDECEAWIISKFKQYGCEVSTQKADLKGWDGTLLHSTNIIARLNPQAQQRIIICAHWDSRPWADNDPDEANHRKPVMAANDGASGIGVMIELARIISANEQQPNYGIDFVCFDAEDYGTPSWSGKEDEDSWALGAQYFAKNYQLSTVNYQLKLGILLDMVGGQGAKFYQEGLSKHYAQSIVDGVWQAANEAGYGSYFLNQTGGYITDDHKPLNEAGIPTIDIIPYYPDCEASAFGPTWHTVNDDIHHLDKNTLKAVGQTIIQYLYTIDN
ncbi:MAG: M28 family peptidase [Prevotella sp.]|nr:M28 family peptidase [Prevotella sp.]